jgi:hypothetical protein
MVQNLGGESFQECPDLYVFQIGRNVCSVRAIEPVTRALASYTYSGWTLFGIQASKYGQVLVSTRGSLASAMITWERHLGQRHGGV